MARDTSASTADEARFLTYARADYGTGCSGLRYKTTDRNGFRTSRHNSTDSRASVRKGLLASAAAAREENTDAARRHRAERRRFRIMASLGTISAIATVVLAVFTALNFYSKVQA
ncbi:hypothetical protein PG990_005277 [Apiospora arundinis]